MKNIRLIFSDKLKNILKKLEDDNNYVSFELLYLTEPESKYNNELNISNVDIGKDFTFDVKIGDKRYYMKIGKFLRYYFPGIFTTDEITKFAHAYNEVKNGKGTKSTYKRIPVQRFTFNPKDPRSTFLSMVTKTYPHGHEEEVLEFLPRDLKKDKFGNYYKIIGDDQSKTMFTSHLDTADRKQEITTLYSYQNEDGDEIICTDGSTVLGADDKSGVTVMLYMMANNVPGLYYFFIGEERGGIGSRALNDQYEMFSYLKSIKSCISFDRRRTVSVITHQMGRRCASDEFGTALCEEYNKNGLNLLLDSTGVFTDSASFIENIPECTNISVGYLNEHTGKEIQNMTYLKELCEASVKVNWNSLPIKRKVGIDEEILRKHKSLINQIKSEKFGLDVRIIGEEGKVFIRIDLDYADVTVSYDNLIWIQNILNKYKVDDFSWLEETYIKIELR
jgi:hypothetical protein